jgi:uncharacterized protein YraI
MKQIFVALFIAALFMSTEAAIAADGQAVFTVAGVPGAGQLNVRSKPKPAAPIVGTMQNGDQGFVLLNDCWNSKTGKKIKQAQVNLMKPNTWCAVMNGDVDNSFQGYARTNYLQ